MYNKTQTVFSTNTTLKYHKGLLSLLRGDRLACHGTDPLRARGSFGDAEIALGNIYNYCNFGTWFCGTEQCFVISMDSYEWAHKASRGCGVKGAQQAGPGVTPLVQMVAKTLGRGSAAQAAWPHTGGNSGGDNKSTGCQGLTI